MPTKPMHATFKGGFYNNKKNGGVDDRVYTAADLRRPYDVIFTDGIKPVEDGTAGDTLKVKSIGGMSISVGKGFAKLGGAWFENGGEYEITLDTASNVDRYDCVIIRNDDSEEVRAPSIDIKSLSQMPIEADLARDDDVYEICVAVVHVPAFAESITDANITDTRDDGILCQVMSGVGAVVVRIYRNLYFSEQEGQKEIPIGIPFFNRYRDRLTVIVEGKILAEDRYTIDSNEQITLALGLPVVGTRVEFEVSKNVNAAGADTVVQEVGELMKFSISANKVLQYHYYCNGVNDNIVLSEMAQTFLDASDEDNKKMTIYVHGHFGAEYPYSGNGTAANPFVWFRFGKDVSTSRKIIFDFANSSRININVSANSQNTLFSGHNMHLKNAYVRAEQPLTSTSGGVHGLDSKSGKVQIDACTIVINGARACIVAFTGTFNDCYLLVSNKSSNAFTLYGNTDSLLIINGGELYAYAGEGLVATCLFVESAGTNCVVKADKMNCPIYAREGLFQVQAIRDFSKNGLSSYRDTITPLAISAEGQTVEGTAAVNKFNRV